jgi:3',5'-cyclic AMP phosphodiesterase CpdA
VLADRSLIQLTDVHVFAWRALRPRFLLDKRLLGGMNALLRRRRQHRPEIWRAAVRAIGDLRPDHLLVTGDVTTLGAEAELVAFRQALAPLALQPEAITVLPGNHDVYVPAVVASGAFVRVLGDYQRSDPEYAEEPWPLVRVRGDVAIVGCSTAVPSGPFLAVGVLGAAQLGRLERLLADPVLGRCARVVALHHPPQPGAARLHNRLRDAEAFRAVLRRQGADVVLHGHLHRSLGAELAGPHGPIPVLGTGSVSSTQTRPGREAQFRRLVFHGRELVRRELWTYSAEAGAFRLER